MKHTCRIARDALTAAWLCAAAATAQDGLVYQGMIRQTTLTKVTGIVVSPDGRHLYITSSKATVATMKRDPATGLVDPGAVLESYADPDSRRHRLSSADNITVSPDGRHVYLSADRDGRAVYGFTRNSESGALTFAGSVSGPRPLAPV